MTPIRTQRSRNKQPGIPIGSVYVGRPSQWGNPAVIGEFYNGHLIKTKFDAVSCFYDHCKTFALNDPVAFRLWLLPLIDRNVCCWCPIDEPCHGDILVALTRHLRQTIDIVDNGTQIQSSIPFWPDISNIFVL
jgi:hypothetical protein